METQKNHVGKLQKLQEEARALDKNLPFDVNLARSFLATATDADIVIKIFELLRDISLNAAELTEISLYLSCLSKLPDKIRVDLLKKIEFIVLSTDDKWAPTEEMFNACLFSLRVVSTLFPLLSPEDQVTFVAQIIEWIQDSRVNISIRARLGAMLPSLGLSQEEIETLMKQLPPEQNEMVKDQIRRAIKETWGFLQ